VGAFPTLGWPNHGIVAKSQLITREQRLIKIPFWLIQLFLGFMLITGKGFIFADCEHCMDT